MKIFFFLLLIKKDFSVTKEDFRNINHKSNLEISLDRNKNNIYLKKFYQVFHYVKMAEVCAKCKL